MAWSHLRSPQSDHTLEMSPLPYHQCLFCNHLNPTGASFCNDCGSQLHLQPCDRCGALNKRTASDCHKCGAGFTLPAAPERNAFAPAKLSRRTLRMAALALLFVAIVVSGEYYSEQSAEFTKTQGVIPFAPRVSGLPIPPDATPPPLPLPPPPPLPPQPPSPVATQAGVAPVPPDPMPKLAADTSRPAETRSRAPPAAGATLTVRPPAASAADAVSRQEPPIFKECPDSVAALGFCSSSSKHEEQ